VSKQDYTRDLTTFGGINPTEYGFEIAFGLGVPLDPKIGYYSVNEVVNSINYNATGHRSSRVKVKTPV
jgi:hypothetical protein